MIPEAIEKDRDVLVLKPVMDWYRMQPRAKQLQTRRMIAGLRVEFYKWRRL